MHDYHVHCNYSFDSEASLREQCRAASAAGLCGLCFTDHVDYESDPPFFPIADLSGRDAELGGLREEFPDLDIRRGGEVGLGDREGTERGLRYVEATKPDFIIASLHMVDGVDIYEPEYFEGRSQEAGYRLYAQRLAEYLPYCADRFSVLGHYDYCAKRAPFPERSFHLSHAPEEMDFILRHLVRLGKSFEINTSAWRESPPWGLDVIRRFVELGGEYVSFGSDAHRPENVGKHFQAASQLAKAGGLRYYASFERMQPVLHPIP